MVDGAIARTPAALVETGKHCDGFEQRRFAGAVLADDDGHRTVERQLEAGIAEQGEAERIGLPARYLLLIEPDPLEIGRGKSGMSAHAGHVPVLAKTA